MKGVLWKAAKRLQYAGREGTQLLPDLHTRRTPTQNDIYQTLY